MIKVIAAAASRLKRQDGASTTPRTVSVLAGTTIDAAGWHHVTPFATWARTSHHQETSLFHLAVYLLHPQPLRAYGGALAWLLAATLPAWASDPAPEVKPACVIRTAGETTQASVMKVHPGDEELLARLTYAEGRSTGFADDALVYQGIAWGVMNRVRLGEVSTTARGQYGSGVAGVVFQPHQFNPAVSSRSPFSQDFLCPQDNSRWQLAMDAARTAWRGQDNPFIQTPWERQHGRSLVVNFYYPRSSQASGPLAPWEDSRALQFIGDPPPGGDLPTAERIRFYRLAQPPR